MQYVEDVSFLYDALNVAERVSGIDKDVYLWIQHEGSITHSTSKQKISDKCAAWLWAIRKEMSYVQSDVNMMFVRAVRSRAYNHTFILLYNSFAYLSPKETKYYISELKKIDAYPFEFGEYFISDAVLKYRVLHWFMNKYVLWMTCCYGKSFIGKLKRKE